jgi:hypothetical protein
MKFESINTARRIVKNTGDTLAIRFITGGDT